jgi:hypothetical protein
MAKKAAKPDVTVRFANPGAKTMAKSKKNPKRAKRSSRRKNPANPRRAGARRRRNPSGMSNKFGDRFLKLAGATVAAVGGGIVSYVAMSKLAQYGQVAEYAVPVALLATGAALAKSHPLIGGGIAIGSAAPFVPLAASKVLALMPATTPAATTTTPTTTTGALGYRNVRAMGAVQMGAVQMGQARYRNVQGYGY